MSNNNPRDEWKDKESYKEIREEMEKRRKYIIEIEKRRREDILEIEKREYIYEKRSHPNERIIKTSSVKSDSPKPPKPR